MIKNLLSISTTLIVLNLYLPLHAQDNRAKIESEGREIVGEILAVRDSIPVPYADIYVIDSSETTATSISGAFKLKVRPSDIIRVSAIGYQNDTILGSDLIDRKNQNIHYLNPAIFQIDQINVTRAIDLRIGEKDEIPVNMRGNGKGKEAVREFYQYNKKWKDFHNKATPEKIKKITGATPEQFEKFIILFNTLHKLSPSATESEISERIDYIWRTFLSVEEAKKRGEEVIEIRSVDERTSRRYRRKKRKGKL